MKGRIMKRPAIVLASLLSAVLLATLPLIPTAFLFRFTPLAYHSSANRSSLEADKVSDALMPVWQHEKYGGTPGLPGFLSLYEYLRGYRIGILSVKDASATERQHGCAACSIVVETGYSCGAFCGGGTTFYLALADGKWKVETYALWAS